MTPRSRIARALVAAAALVAFYVRVTPLLVGILVGAIAIDLYLGARDAWASVDWR